MKSVSDRAPQFRPHLASLVADLRRHGNQPALTSRHGLRTVAFTYAQLAELAARCAHYLHLRGVGKGDRVVIWGQNGAEWLAVFYACILRGAVSVPIDVAGSPEFAQRVIADVGAKLVFGPADLSENFAAHFPAEPLYDPIPNLEETDTLQIVFTSGTTGEPKGVVHTHRNVLASLRPIERETQKYMRYERFFHPLGIVHTLPLSHVFGQFMGIWIPVLLGAVVHFEARLNPADLVALIRRERASVLAAVPRVLEILATHLRARFPGLDARLERARGVSVWKRWWMFRDAHRALGLKFWALVSGGATLPSATETFWTTLGFAVIQGYGMTETAALVSLSHPFHPVRGAIGRVLPGREIRLSDEGEILVRGETVSGATWEQGRMHAGESEWLATGDLAAIDAAGNLTFRGRKKDVIVTSAGLNIYPEDLEAALLRQPGVRAASIVEYTSPQGPQPMAALVLDAGGEPESAVQAANRDLAEYQQIRRWMVWPEPDLPRTTTGKVLRRKIAAAVKLDGGDPAAQGGIAALLGRDDAARLSEDLHLDSLGRVELQSAIETQFGIDTSGEQFQRAQTVGELKQLLRSPEPSTPGFTYALWPWSLPIRAIRAAFFELVIRPLTKLLAAPRIERAFDPLPPKPVLIVANHITEYDAPLILSALPGPMRRRVAIAMAGEMLLGFRRSRNPFTRLRYWLAVALFNVFPLPQRGNFRPSFAHAGRAMDRGYHVLVFPEGRRATGTAMHEFQGGSGILWTQLGCDALPVYLAGLAELRAERARWFRSGRIVVRVGEPIPLPAGADPKTAAALLEQRVRSLADA